MTSLGLQSVLAGTSGQWILVLGGIALFWLVILVLVIVLVVKEWNAESVTPAKPSGERFSRDPEKSTAPMSEPLPPAGESAPKPSLASAMKESGSTNASEPAAREAAVATPRFVRRERLPIGREEVHVRGPGAAHVVDLEVISARLDRELGRAVRRDLDPAELRIRGVDDEMVWNRHPSVLFHAAYAYDEKARARADVILPDAYRLLLRAPEPRGYEDDLLGAVVRYAVFRGKSAWILNLSWLFGIPFLDELAVAVLLESGNDSEIWYHRARIDETRPQIRTSTGDGSDAVLVSAVRWMARGQVRRAAGLVRRRGRGEAWAGEFLIRLFLANGRFASVLRVLESRPHWPHAWAYAAGVYALLEIGTQDMGAGIARMLESDADSPVSEAHLMEFSDALLERASPGTRSGFESMLLRVRRITDLDQARDSSAARDELTRSSDAELFDLGVAAGISSMLEAGAAQARELLRSTAGGNTASRIAYGLLLHQEGADEKAEKVLSGAGRHPLGLHALSEIYLESSRYAEAAEAYEAILRRCPDESVFWRNYAAILEEDTRYDEARIALMEASRIEAVRQKTVALKQASGEA